MVSFRFVLVVYSVGQKYRCLIFLDVVSFLFASHTTEGNFSLHSSLLHHEVQQPEKFGHLHGQGELVNMFIMIYREKVSIMIG